MDNRMTIRIKKPGQSELLIGIVMWLPFLCATFVELLDMPRSILYLCDVGWLCLLILLSIQKKRSCDTQQTISVWIILFVTYCVIVYLVQYQSVLYCLWGIRNSFRFYVAFCAIVYFWKEQHAGNYFVLMDMLFWVDVIVSLFQFFALEISGDYLGGIFGTQQGVNGYSTIFLLIVITKSCVFCFCKRESLRSCRVKCLGAILMAALAEMKFFFVGFLLVVCLAVMFTRFSWSKLLLVVSAAVAVVLGSALLANVFSSDKNWFTWEWMYNLASSDKGYTSSGDLNRLNAIPQINELWFKNGWQRLFGLGLGNCDTSAFALLNTPFFEKYGDYHYTWLSYAMIYLETGWIGLIFYFGFFLLVYREICRIQKRVQGEAVCYCLIGRIMAILCMIISIYNSSLRTEAGYMAYFVLAIPFIYGKCRKWEITRER